MDPSVFQFRRNQRRKDLVFGMLSYHSSVWVNEASLGVGASCVVLFYAATGTVDANVFLAAFFGPSNL